MITLENLTYSYNRRRTLFNGLTLRLQAGKVYGLFGKNGAGKSTLMKSVSGLLFPQTGVCRVNGYEPCRREPGFLEQLFFIPEVCELPTLTLARFKEVYAPFYPAFNEQQFKGYLDEFKVDVTRVLTALSYGQQKKAFISFALAANTKLLIMDEPTNGLDIPSKMQFRNIVAKLSHHNKTIIISTHQVRDLDDLISGVIIMEDGEVLLHEDRAAITQRLHFQHTDQSPQTGDVLYAEPAPYGWNIITENTSGIPGALDMEVLFNAVVSGNIKALPLGEKETTYGQH